MSVAIRQIHPVFVGEVSGLDISRPLARDEVAAIEAGMDRHAVLVFHDQKLTDEQQMVFSRSFGALENARGGNIGKPEDRRLEVGMNEQSVVQWAHALHVHERSLAYVRDLARGEVKKAVHDFYRLNWSVTWTAERPGSRHCFTASAIRRTR
jgi:hypothetical protein